MWWVGYISEDTKYLTYFDCFWHFYCYRCCCQYVHYCATPTLTTRWSQRLRGCTRLTCPSTMSAPGSGPGSTPCRRRGSRQNRAGSWSSISTLFGLQLQLFSHQTEQNRVKQTFNEFCLQKFWLLPSI